MKDMFLLFLELASLATPIAAGADFLEQNFWLMQYHEILNLVFKAIRINEKFILYKNKDENLEDAPAGELKKSICYSLSCWQLEIKRY